MGVGYNSFTSATLAPWEKVMSASTEGSQVSAEDLTPEEVQTAMLNNPTLTKSPSWIDSSTGRNVSLVPYDMQIGAQLMNDFTQPVTQSPPPSQMIVSEQFVAQCPMIMFNDALYISAPKCGSNMGMWEDPTSGRSILRWQSMDGGGIQLGIDSVVGGNGSTLFATCQQQMSVTSTYFSLANCLGVLRYNIEETVMKVDHIGKGVTSTMQAHDISKTSEAFFYLYTIIAPNGTKVAQTSLYRMGQTNINVTLFDGDSATGALLATATKSGTWSASDWTACSSTPRTWDIAFQIDQREFNTVATVMDLRVATAAMLTLMAFRDQSISVKTGVTRQGEKSMLEHILIAVLIGLIASLVCLLFSVVMKRKGWDAKARRICFKFEQAALPRRPAQHRAPSFPTTY
jgi:hypothetical protein